VWIDIGRPLDAVVAQVNETRPDVLASFGTYLEELFKTLGHRGVSMWTPKVVLYFGDNLSPDGRAFIEREFGTPVLSRYNAVESFKIGYFCERRRGFHLHEDLCHVRLVDPSGAPVARDGVGEVVISNLVNRATVLLNYRLGDLARVVGDRCDCGRPSPLLSELEGRVSGTLRLPNGNLVHPFAVLAIVRRQQGITASQLVQVEPERYELRLATVDGDSFAAAAPPLEAELGALLDAPVDVVRRDRVERGPRGKLPPVVALPR